MSSEMYDSDSSNTNYFQPEQTENTLRIRLEIEEALEDIEMFLSGQKIVSNDEGKLVKAPIGNPKANEQGVREIMKVVRSYVNRGTVQGNITDVQMDSLMLDYKRGMANLLSFHCDEWVINRNERVDIVNFIEPFILMYISRAKDDGERQSYMATIRDRQKEVISNGQSGFSMFKK